MKRILLLLVCWCLLGPVRGADLGEVAVASAHPLATEAGIAILKEGGNAFDAAVTVASVLAVAEPYASGLGGGGFWLLHRASDGRQLMLDGRERAPLAASPDMFLDAEGHPVEGLSINGPLAAGIPGVPAVLEKLALEFGRLPLKRTLAPAIELARNGVPVDDYLRYMITMRRQVLASSPAASALFLPKGQAPDKGQVIRQPDLAATLERLAERGAAGFYQGELAKLLVDGVKAAGGHWQLEDLARYRVLERQPVVGSFRGMRVVSAAPPSSGGVALLQSLNLIERMPDEVKDEAGRVHWLVESLRRVFRDRAQYLGDPDFTRVPQALLLSKELAASVAGGIDGQIATPSESLPAVTTTSPRGKDTSHYSIIDAEGNRVAATLSINLPFGSGFMVPGSGVLLNNQMDDFSLKPGTANSHGLVGNQANAIAPGKRPLSSMSPTFLENGRGVAVLGTPGGSRIISMVLLATLGYFGDADAQSLVQRPRFHHQYLPDHIFMEPGAFSPEVHAHLTKLGHRIEQTQGGHDDSGRYGNLQVVLWERKGNRLQAASDPRGVGKAIVAKVGIRPKQP